MTEFKEGKRAKVKSFSNTRLVFGVTPSMREMLGKVYKIKKVSPSIYENSGLCVNLDSWNWSSHDLELVVPKKIKTKIETFDTGNLFI